MKQTVFPNTGMLVSVNHVMLGRWALSAFIESIGLQGAPIIGFHYKFNEMLAKNIDLQ